MPMPDRNGPPPAIAQLPWLDRGNGGMDMIYQVEADWTLLTTCNFRCNYCFTPPDVLGAKLKVYGTNVQWAEGFKATGKKWLLHLTGGEPCIYPGFVDLCHQLARDHYLSINSNLSHPSIDVLAERIDPERVHYINAAVHYDERQKKASLDVFVERVHRLQRHRFHVLVSIIMTPRIVAAFPAVSAYFESRGLCLIPKVMRANYHDQGYPAAYSSDQKAFILERLAEARRQYAAVTNAMGEAATIDMFADGRFLGGGVDYRGKLCGSGHNFVMIEPDGTLRRCGSGNCLGNILLANVSLLGGPQACDTSYCPYWCEKYTSPQFVRAE
jgi:MoaA/NifB/PqqE/SkfB family radical SAM enzyme